MRSSVAGCAVNLWSTLKVSGIARQRGRWRGGVGRGGAGQPRPLNSGLNNLVWCGGVCLVLLCFVVDPDTRRLAPGPRGGGGHLLLITSERVLRVKQFLTKVDPRGILSGVSTRALTYVGNMLSNTATIISYTTQQDLCLIPVGN